MSVPSVSPSESSSPVLSVAEIEQFVSEGYVMLREAFPRRVAQAVRQTLWRHLEADYGMREDDRSTWTQAQAHLQITLSDATAFEAYSPRVCGAFDQLMGAGRWQMPDGLGWWPVRFPGFSQPPWTAPEKGWHVDGQNFHHHLTSREQGMLVIFVFSDIGPGDGGTAFVPGSHRLAARVLAEHEPEGMDPPALNQAMKALPRDRVLEVNGQAGDVVLLHPFMLHSGSANVGDRVRFICNVQAPLKDAMRLDRPDLAELSPVERAIREAIDARPVG